MKKQNSKAEKADIEYSSTDKAILKDRSARLDIVRDVLGKSGLVIIDAKKDAKTPRISTGILSLDEATSGGLMEGRVTEFFGEEASGKSLAALLTVAEAQRQGKFCVFFDVEYGFDAEWAHKLGVDTSPECFAIPDIADVKPKKGKEDDETDEKVQIMTAEKIFDSICKLAESKSVGLIVVDSIAAMIPAEEYEGEIEDQKYAALAKVIKKGIGRAVPLCARTGTTLIIINQVRDTIGSYIKSVHTPGGRMLKHLLSTRIMFKKGASDDSMKKDDQVNGVNIGCKVHKHRGGPNFREATFKLWYNTGFDKEYDMYSYLVSKGAIKVEGAMQRFEDENVRGMQAFVNKIKNEPAFAARVSNVAKSFIVDANKKAVAEAEVEEPIKEEVKE